MYTASATAEVNVEHDLVQRNGKTHLIVENVKAKFEIGYFSMRMHSKLLNPIINDLINKVMNTQWRGIYKEVRCEFEEYVGKIIQSIVSLIVEKVSIQDFLHL